MSASGDADGGETLPSALALAKRKEQFMPAFHRQYFVSASQALNVSRYAVDKLQLGGSVLSSAMCYWHEFAVQHGPRAFNEVVLASACIFLAAKVEHYKLRIVHILSTVFELDVRNLPEKELAPWRNMVLDMELVLSDTLGFDFQRVHPIRAAVDAIGKPNRKSADALTQEEQTLAKDLQDKLNRCYVLSLLTPLYAKVPSGDVLATLIYQFVTSEGCEKAYEWIWKADADAQTNKPLFPLPDAERQGDILSVFVDAFAYMRKVTGIKTLDALIQRRRKRSRNPTS